MYLVGVCMRYRLQTIDVYVYGQRKLHTASFVGTKTRFVGLVDVGLAERRCNLCHFSITIQYGPAFSY